MADLPVLPAEARRRIETAAQKARIRFQAQQRGCLRENAFRPYEQELDPDRSEQVSINYAFEVFQAKAAEYWKVRTDHQAFKGWLALLFEEVLEDVKRKWQALNWQDQSTFEVVCLPKVKDALKDERDKWLLRSLDEEALKVEEPVPAEGGFSKVEPTVDTQSATVPNGGKEENTVAANWDAIEISFTSEERVQIHRGTQTETRNYSELGCEDRRSGKPNRAWQTLKFLAKQNGIVRDFATAGRDQSRVEKRMQELRRVFRKHFGIATDPLPFIAGTGYQARFKIGCSSSFDA